MEKIGFEAPIRPFLGLLVKVDKFYSKTVREAKTLAQAQQQPAKMS
ncbi:conserved hypothetical protein (plasmid) [Borreliella afzelii PKo]|uniref:Uncharacterized protein n=1 Tax=Borreliella afzelii (strain PKo) TaxID=390236 RepID=Q0SKX1_BORAP|nr:hypothetical protein BAPKO_6032 [Borreliella afzelii PKo]AEL70411.1 conserved hypothetical protein [Borreliella afzelii PKo]